MLDGSLQNAVGLAVSAPPYRCVDDIFGQSLRPNCHAMASTLSPFYFESFAGFTLSAGSIWPNIWPP